MTLQIWKWKVGGHGHGSLNGICLFALWSLWRFIFHSAAFLPIFHPSLQRKNYIFFGIKVLEMCVKMCMSKCVCVYQCVCVCVCVWYMVICTSIFVCLQMHTNTQYWHCHRQWCFCIFKFQPCFSSYFMSLWWSCPISYNPLLKYTHTQAQAYSHFK